MKKGYWIILVFAIWCVVSAVWYMFSVKGLPANTALVKPATTTVAILEIIVMMTVAFLLGFGVAWMMRSESLEDARDEIINFEYQVRELEARITGQKEAAENAEKLVQLAENKAVKAQLSSEETAVKLEQLRSVNRDLETKIQVLEGEVNSSKFRIRILESELSDKNTAIGALTQELDEAGTQPKVEHREWSDHPFVRPVEAPASTDEKDDLTEIKGIGPAFQKKLNMLDINSFRQLSELDGEAVERLAEIIEVFPERIHRDNWIGQATKLYMRKLGREV